MVSTADAAQGGSDVTWVLDPEATRMWFASALAA
jgi:hypothetical protein